MAEQTLLIIDPNPQSLNVMEVQLRTYDYEVLTALSVERALRILSVSPPDLIICEYALDAGERAVDLCERLKNEVVTSTIPFMIIVEHDHQRVECLVVAPRGAAQLTHLRSRVRSRSRPRAYARLSSAQLS